MTRDEFFARLDHRPDDASEAAAFDAAIWEQHRATRALLVTDLSGFTRLTKVYGIVHFLKIFRRCVKLAGPAIQANGGKLLKFAADNLMATFDEPAHALAAARQLLDAADADNQHHPDDLHVRICCGVGYGEMLLLEDDCFGDDVNVAFKLGEDVAEPFEILCSEAAVNRLHVNGVTTGLDDRRAVEVGGVMLNHVAAERA